jgi:hypothetical protein
VGLLLPGVHYWRAALPNPVLTIKLADWVTDFVGTLARMLAHVGLPPDPARERFYEAGTRVRTVSRAQVRQPVNARGLGRWRTCSPPNIDVISIDTWKPLAARQVRFRRNAMAPTAKIV